MRDTISLTVMHEGISYTREFDIGYERDMEVSIIENSLQCLSSFVDLLINDIETSRLSRRHVFEPVDGNR